jgi:hypothetical protein
VLYLVIFSTAGQIEPALKLAKGLLTIEPDPQMSKEANEEDTYLLPNSQPLFDLWHYEQILKRNVPDLVTAAGDESLKFLGGMLGAAVRLSEKAGETAGQTITRTSGGQILSILTIWTFGYRRPGRSVANGGNRIRQKFLKSFRSLRPENGACFTGSHLMFCGCLPKGLRL